MTLTSSMMFSPEFSQSGKRTLHHFFFIQSNLIICRQVRKKIKGMDICYKHVKRNPLQ